MDVEQEEAVLRVEQDQPRRRPLDHFDLSSLRRVDRAVGQDAGATRTFEPGEGLDDRLVWSSEPLPTPPCIIAYSPLTW